MQTAFIKVWLVLESQEFDNDRSSSNTDMDNYSAGTDSQFDNMDDIRHNNHQILYHVESDENLQQQW